jgi:hypothetical protein
MPHLRRNCTGIRLQDNGFSVFVNDCHALGQARRQRLPACMLHSSNTIQLHANCF